MPRPDLAPPKTGIAVLVAAVGTAVAAILVPTVAGFEGKSNDPYRDIVGVETVCYGETRVAMRRYSDAECSDMLARALAGFGRAVLTCTPSLKAKPHALAAAASLAYNIGAPAYCRSSVDRRFDAGNARGACDAFLMWNRAGGRVAAGLDRRRKAERALCLKDVRP